MLTQEIIRKKRDKGILTNAEIEQFCKGVVDKSVGEGQIGSFCMAVLLNGLSMDERVGLTLAMAKSGIIVDWSQLKLDGPVLDKHSTGGVGDKVSLMLAPMIAACGGYVPMISGRGLGHTGGTLDKMDSIKGYVSQPDLETLRRVVKKVGCAVVGATKDIAPADRTMYAVRDVTGTVESIDLITASILSKKLAAGLQGLVLDVKFGTGAFMQKYEDAKSLAQSLVTVANGAGMKTVALMTDMNEVLGRTAGNAIEVREAIEFLRGEGIDQRLYEITMAQTGELLALGGLARDREEGIKKAEEALKSGKAAEIFGKMVHELGGPADIVENFAKHLPLAPVQREIHAAQPGYVETVDTRAVGLAVIELGGGRRLVTDPVDHSVGFASIAAIGEHVGPDRPLAICFAKNQASLSKAEALVQQAYKISDKPVKPGPKLRDTVRG